MELNKILEGITPMGMNEGDKIIIQVVNGTAVVSFEPAKNENFLNDFIEDDEDYEEDYEEEDEEVDDEEDKINKLQDILNQLKSLVK